jgi:hypothetical protein
MDIDQFHEELRQNVLVRSDSTDNFIDDALTEVISDLLMESGSIEDFIPCKYFHRSLGVRVDGYALKWDEALIELYVTDCRRSEFVEKMSKAEMNQAFKRVETFFERSCRTAFVEQMEASHPGFALARTILDQGHHIKRVRFHLFTNASLTSSVKEIAPKTENFREWSYRIWDVDRLAKSGGAGTPEPIAIDFEEMFGRKLVCLPADDGEGDVRCFLAVIPGDWLSHIYDVYGGRLLEQNVRTFLQARGKVNKGIRKTILEEPRRLFPYNNGISATAEEIDEVRDGGISHVRSIKNLQIVNGGQTTASIFNVAKKDGGAGNLGLLSVQMKLSVVKPEIAAELVPKISRFANSQNKVSDSDFFSNHPFHVVVENLSRRLSAPAVHGSQIMTNWFYERAAGQFANASAYLSPSKKREFLARNPRHQVISKTDLAKYLQTFRELPQEVSLGAQKNFSRFAEYISEAWDQKQHDFNELWYRHAISEAIVFRRMETLVLRAPWYAQGYRANTVTYGIALLLNRVRQAKGELDTQWIWREQSVP